MVYRELKTRKATYTFLLLNVCRQDGTCVSLKLAVAKAGSDVPRWSQVHADFVLEYRLLEAVL